MLKYGHIILLFAMLISCSRKNDSAVSITENSANNSEAGIAAEAYNKSGSEGIIVQMQSSQSKNDKKSPAASSLKGKDRQLLSKPLDGLFAGDFVIGQTGELDSRFIDVMNSLKAGLLRGRMDYSHFTNNCAEISRLLYNDADLKGIYGLRYSVAKIAPGGSYSLKFRVFSKTGTDNCSSVGSIVLATDKDASWKIHHFELDLPALKIPSQRSKAWDPYLDQNL
ncbi:hypothetical protein MASR2M29_12090 [Spirochaetota bacterium]